MVETAFSQKPVANFGANIKSGCAPLIVQFSDSSTNNPTSWKWDLGNGTFSTSQNPVATFFNPGSYNVQLIATNASGSDTITKINYIVVNDVPTINFSATPTTGCFPLNVQFSDLSTPNSGTLSSWTWDFGDGNFSNIQNPSHTYNVAGNFTVTLKVKNSAGCEKILNKPNYINIPGGVKANFNVNPLLSCTLPVNASFNNTSTGTGVISYQWNFGDGGTSTQIAPIHTYTASGSYTVTLIAVNNSGCRDTLVRTNYINIGAVAANFSYTATCINKPITFTNTSTPNPSSVIWYFDDGTTSTQNNPVKTFTSLINHTVKLVADFGVCKDSIIKTITISPNPTAVFTNLPKGSCLPPLNVNFTNASVGATSYQWTFGDGGTSTQFSPSHTYTQSGFFNVTLVAITNAGCTDTLKLDSTVIIAPPKIIKLNQGAPYQGCAPYSATFGASVSSMDVVTNYLWDFGDGTPVVNGVNPSHTYSSVGTYNIKLIVITANGCTDTLIHNAAIILSAKPTANFSATPRNACGNDQIHFTNLSTGTINEYLWMFGDGGTSNEMNPIYNYNDTGYFTVKLIVANNKCKDSISFIKYIYINPPIARFIETFNCDTPLQRRFIDQSLTNGPVTYAWDFGDGNTSSASNPVHVYTTPGYYNVHLTVSNATCSHTATDSVFITNTKADFSINGSSFCKHANVIFTVNNTVNSLIEKYEWNFGDGTDSIGANLSTITHQYNSSGNVSPTLTLTDTLGCVYSLTQTVPIVIYGPKADFSNPAGTCINGTINFTDNSTTDGVHPITKYIWFYGDGKSDTLTAPPFSHQYITANTFDVQLKVLDNFGCNDTLLKPSAVLITKPVANFNTPDTIICANANVQFTNTSSGVNLNYQWDFGDTQTSTANNAIHAYSTEGQYSIKLAISDIFGCTDTLYKPLYIRVANSKASFSFLQGGSIGLCYPFLIKVGSSAINTESVSWSFGDGGFSNLDTPSHFYNYAGHYNLTLRAYGYGGCVDSVTTHMEIRGPTGTFTYTPLKFCSPASVKFTANTLNNASFVWDFNDGNVTTTTDSVVTHVFANGGSFKPKMILIDASGCQVPITGADTIKIIEAITKIKVPQTKFCDSVRLNFSDSTKIINDVVSSYFWNFGDGTTSTATNPTHFYAQLGNYTTSLLITTAFGCKGTDTLNVPINIIKTPKIKIAGDSVGCVYKPIQYNGVVLASDTNHINWSWNFGNGNTSTLQTPALQYFSTANTYNISLVASNVGNCKDSVNKTIVINPNPVIDAGLDSFVCKGNSIMLTPTGGNNYVWRTDNTLSCTNCTNPLASPNTLHLYSVTGYNSFGCSSTDSVYINVIQPFVMNVSNTDTLCIGEKTQLNATGAVSYTWLPTTGLDNPNIKNPLASPIITTLYTVIGTDEKKCFNDTGYINIVVYDYPKFNIVETLIKANVGNNIPIVTTNSSDIIKWKWTPPTWLNCNNCGTPVATITQDVKYVAEAINAGGCTTKDEITIEALCNGYNIFIPNTFSPNGDGMNDIFFPRGKGIFAIRNWKIFNRWGEVVFNKNEATANLATDGWDGTYKGQKLGPDVYVYFLEVICDNNTVIPVKGNIAIIK